MGIHSLNDYHSVGLNLLCLFVAVVLICLQEIKAADVYYMK